MARVSYGLAITQRAREAPDRVAVVCGDEELSRAELERRSNRMARAFLAHPRCDDYWTERTPQLPELPPS